MAHDSELIAAVAAALGLAFVLGLAATRLRLPPLVGYLLAGVAVGPYTPGFHVDPELAGQLAEIGVILLMFGVGVHFSLADLLAVRRIAVPGAVVQIALATLLGAGAARLWGWSWGAGIVFGLCLSVASTVVLLRALENRGLLHSTDGRIAVGWLIVEDLATVLVLVLLPPLALTLGAAAPGVAGGPGILLTLLLTFARVAAFVALMLVAGRRVVPWLLERVARTGSRELFTLSVLAVALGIATGAAALFEVSLALGAFFAGTVVNGSDLSHEAAADALPLQDAFSVLFFVSVGMLFDPAIVVGQPLEVLAVVLIVVVGKSFGALGIVLLFRHPLRTALTISASLAQVGEFSFILAALGVSLGLLPAEGQSLVVAAALLSIGLNPVVFAGLPRATRWIEGRPRLLALLEWRSRSAVRDAAEAGGAAPPPPGGHAVVVGYGRVGSTIGEELAARGIPFVVVEQDWRRFEALRESGVPTVYGNASRHGVLEHTGLEHARLLAVTSPDPFEARAVVELATRINPGIATVVRTHSAAEHDYLERQGVGRVVMGERELAHAMARYAIEQLTRRGSGP